tara:strand:- start:3807 stop:4073 length:267 start_codon:yes stop_codon:yes gene_type:complete
MPETTDRNELIRSLAEIAGMEIIEVEDTLEELERGGLINMDRTGERTPIITLSKDARDHAEQLVHSPLDSDPRQPSSRPRSHRGDAEG